MKVACPICRQKENSLRGDGCCLCDYSGMIPEEEAARLMNPKAKNNGEEEYPFISDIDLKAGQKYIQERMTVELIK